ncbi:MAG TPA: hypothetical protein VGC84_05500 [Ilumatobacteraceae bacterium]|jgi:hypothetical protein
MKMHRFDPISLLLGALAIVMGIAAVNSRAGNLINNRPDALIPVVVLAIGVLAVAAGARRSLQNVDGAGHDEHDGAE